MLILFITCVVCKAQNLVPNPSFEDTVSCPTSYAQMSTAVAWSDYRGSPDNFNPCNTSVVSVPNNVFGFQYAHTGNAYAGFGAYQVGLLNGAREDLGAQLIQPLVIGQKYFISFYVSRANNDILAIGAACNKLGMRFSTVAYSYATPVPLDNFAQVYTDSIIIDTLNWTKISGSFIADFTYEYLMVGNFFTDSFTSYSQYDSTDIQGYYFVDDIVVSTDSTLTIVINENNQPDDFLLYPNPFNYELKVTLEGNNFCDIILYDLTSRILMKQSFSNSISINTEQLARGIYIYEVRNNSGGSGGVIKKGKVMKN